MRPLTLIGIRRMRTLLRSMVLGPALAAALSGCSDFLTGPKLQDDPNNPTTASNEALFVASQVSISAQLESRLARTICIWMQQCGGQTQYLSLGTYSVGEDDYYINWSAFYGGGGLRDLRTIQARALLSGDSIFFGVAAVLEAYAIGTVADIWGDVPYSQAANPSIPTPVPDPQQAVYAAVQAKLDSAIAFLGGTGPRNKGPSDNDLVYAGDPALWTALAHTLKARYFLHTALRDPSAYGKALTEAASGIQQGNDYALALSGQGATSSDLWSVFQSIFPGYLYAGSFLVNTMNGPPADPRLPLYFAQNGNGQFVGADPGVSGSPDLLSTLSNTRLDGAFKQPFVTWEENQLIIAEASYQVDHSDASSVARNALQAVWTANGVTLLMPAPGTPGPNDPLFKAILTEKYIGNFQNIDAWQDWKRTGIPDLVPASGGVIPRRLVYPLSERNTNPSIVGPGPARNWNDP
jgi:hypothetical protein